jgi:putative salt-induced outer membrane protein YdiY
VHRITPVLAVLALTACDVRAQTMPKPDGEWRGALGAGFTASSGNIDSMTYSINGDAVKQTATDKLSGYLQATYGRRERDGVTERTSDLIRAGAQYDRDLNERTFGFGALDFERNKLIDLDLRSVVAGGLGYHIVKREGLTFDVSSGPAYNREQYTTETREAMEWLFAEESTHALTPAVSFKQRLAYYANLEDGGEYRTVFDAGLVLKVTDRWNATATLNHRHQSNPLPGVEENDLLFVTGLQYVFNP